MINILPNEGRLTARGAYIARLVVVSAFAGALLGVSAIALLLPSYLTTISAVSASKAEAERLTQEKQKNGTDTQALLALAQAEIVAFGPVAKESLPSKSIQSLLRARTSSISITEIQYSAASKHVVLAGVATTREALLAFQQALRKVAGVGAVDLPVNDLAKSENAHFTMSVTLGNRAPVAPESTPVSTTKEE